MPEGHQMDDVNAQHMASMGLADVPLGKAVPSANKGPDGPRCSQVGLSGQCVLYPGHEGLHVRGKARWPSAESVASYPDFIDRRCDSAKDKMPHSEHAYVLGDGLDYRCPGYLEKPSVEAAQAALRAEEQRQALENVRHEDSVMVRLPASDRCHATLRLAARPSTATQPVQEPAYYWCELEPGHGGVHSSGDQEWTDPIRVGAEPTKQRLGDQVLPKGGVDCVQDRIIRDMEESKRVGLERYGQTLHTFAGRRTVVDIHDEVRDLFVYLTQVRMEAEADRDTLVDVVLRAVRAKYLAGEIRDEIFDGVTGIDAKGLAETAVDAIMGWVVGKRQDSGGFEDQEAIATFLDDAWPIYIGVTAPDSKADVIEAMSHALGEFLDVPEADR